MRSIVTASCYSLRRPRRVLLGAVLVLAGWLRLRGLNDATLTNDEMLSWDHAHESLSHILSTTLYPLHHALAWVALTLGSTEGVLRLPSALAGIAGCWVAYAVGKRAHSTPAGLAAALILAVSPFHTLHSREARYYSLMVLAALAVIWLLWRALEDDTPRAWVRFALVSIPAWLVQLFMIPFLAVLYACGAILALLRRPGEGAKRWHLPARFAVAALVGVSGLLALALQDGAPIGMVRTTLESAAQGASSEEAGATRASYRLTPQEFLSYGGEWAFLSTTRGQVASLPAMVVLGLLAAGGLLTLLVRRRTLGVLCAATLLLVPLPFFLIEVTHWHEAKYYAPLFAVLVLCIGVGLGEIGRLAALLLGTRLSEAWRSRAPGLVTAAAALVATAIVGSPILEAQGFAQDRPQYRWREVAAFMQETLGPDDLVFYLADFGPDAASIDRGLHFYFKRDVPNGLATLYSTRPFVGQLDGAALVGHASQHPGNAMWLFSINEGALDSELVAAIERLAPVKQRFGRLTLWAVGTPTANLVADGGFSAEELPEGRNVTVSEGEDGRGIRLEPGVESPRALAIPLMPHPYRLRNADFALWADGPLGWRIESPSPPQLAQVSGPSAGTAGLMVRPAPTGETVISQRIGLGAAAGHAVGIRAMVGTERPEHVGIRLTAGGQRFEAWYEGGDDWGVVQLAAQIPQGLNLEACEVAIIVRPGGDAAVTGVEIGLDPDSPTLDPHTEYTLSFRMKTVGLPLYRDMPRIGLFHEDARAGGTAWVPLYEFGHTVPWQRYAIRIRPGDTLPADARGVMLGVQFQSDLGTVWLDEVQLEPRPSPTLFTQGIRPPHDEQWVQSVLRERVPSE